MINIYNSEFTTRIEYILKFVIVEVLSDSYKFYTDENQYLEAKGPKLNYSNKSIDPNEIRMYNDGFLLETGIRNFEPRISKRKDLIKVFNDPYSHDSFDENYIDFDIFSSIFYFISRYEEHLSFKKDVHGRFEAKQSYAYKNGFIEIPLVDLYIQYLKNKLQHKYSSLSFKQRTFNVQPTIDIDQVFAIKGKGFFRWIGACAKSFLSFNFKKFRKLFAVKLANEKDPYDVYEKFENIHSKYKLTAVYFFLFSKKKTKYDINLSVNNSSFRKVIQKLSIKSIIGIHPSYYSKSNTRIIEDEINSLSAISSQLIDSSRQHYLKFKLPYSYKALMAIGIQNEYSMGYATMPGFRASTSLSYFFYDLTQEQISFLKIHPFSVMDTTFKHYLNTSPSEAYTKICQIIDMIKSVNGQFIPLWHNESMSNYAEWEGWQDVYESMLGYCLESQ